MEKVEFVDQPLFLEEIDGAIDGDEMDVFINFLGAAEECDRRQRMRDSSVVHGQLPNHASRRRSDSSAAPRKLIKTSISSTVYRTIDLLKKQGLIDELDLLHLRGDRHYYENPRSAGPYSRNLPPAAGKYANSNRAYTNN